MSRPDLCFRSEAYVGRPAAEVWELFTDLSRWTAWSPICRGCRIVSGERLQQGAVLRMRLRLAGFDVPVNATIMDFQPPELIAWRAGACGWTAVHAYRFLRHGDGTLMVNEETFKNLPAPLRTLISRWYRARNIGSASLAGLQRLLSARNGGGSSRGQVKQ